MSWFGLRDKYKDLDTWNYRTREALIGVKVNRLTPQETAEIFAEIANGTIVYEQHDLDCDFYTKIDRDPNTGTVLYFHYWGYCKGSMYKFGSGGYIPIIHKKSGQVMEFELKNWTDAFKPKELTQ